MVELIPGSRVYLYQAQLDKVMSKATATARAIVLLMCFYTPEQLLAAGNITGKNDQEGLDAESVDAIVGMYGTFM